MRAALLLAAAALTLGGRSSPPDPRLDPDIPSLAIPASLWGRSGRLFAHIVPPAASEAARPVARMFGPEALRRPAVWSVRDSLSGVPFAFITLRPFADKREGRVGLYRVGRWP